MLVAFPGTDEAAPSEVGGKGAALVGLAAAGLPVPDGLVLTTRFFAPWFDVVTASPTFARLRTEEDWDAVCETLKPESAALPLSPAQRDALTEVAARVEAWGQVAVRSSSPEEDLATASFAGGYTTVLGVTVDGLEAAVRACFLSALDVRVLRYEASHGFDPFTPRMAVVVQRQLASEVAGVGFSVDPVTNDHDEAVLDAAWGLGETVVAGLTNPDHVVVDRPTGAVVAYTKGTKEQSLWLTADGTVERVGHRSDERCLTDTRIAELLAVLEEVEAWLGRPVDIEWAIADDRLYVLQARPITTHLPLPPALMTEPGARRWLYMDASLSNGLTLNVPVSPLGLDWLATIFNQLLERFMGPIARHHRPEGAVYLAEGGRLYANLSYLLWAQTPWLLERSQADMDALMARTLGAIDASRYRSRDLPPFYHPAGLLRVPGLVVAAAPLAMRLVGTLLFPERAFRQYEADIEATERLLRAPMDPEQSFDEAVQQGFTELMDTGFFAIWSALGAFGVGLSLVGALSRGLDRELAMRLQQGFAGNVVVEMGIALDRLARLLEPGDIDDLDHLADRIARRDLPADFLEAWEGFLARHGHRGPVEMDLARPRYRDDPMLVLTQLASMGQTDGDLAERHAQRVRERSEALASVGGLRRLLLRWPDRLLERFAGTRDTPKYLLTLYNDRLRRRALLEGERLVRDGRLDRVEQVFDLTLAELRSAADPTVDLRALAAAHAAFLDPLRGRNLTFPPVIDSRGRIVRPDREETPGELRGMGVSPGVVRGRVRVLHRAEGAVVTPGEVLVAYTTDPGWTPLFVHAGAVVLEIGGTLQHGALVAREYGKPCVVGVSQVTERLQDGVEVEVDGYAGVVRVLGKGAGPTG